jgi:predicted Zn-dependent protease
LAIAYGRNGDLGHSAMASAERAMLIGSLENAKRFAVRAQKILDRGSPGWLRAQDIEQAADRAIEKRKYN